MDGSDNYTLAVSVHDTAPMDSDVEALQESFEGFTAVDDVKIIRIGTDEDKNVADYYYTRNQYNLSWNLSGGVHIIIHPERFTMMRRLRTGTCDRRIFI